MAKDLGMIAFGKVKALEKRIKVLEDKPIERNTMIKNVTLEIKSCENGFMVERAWYETKVDDGQVLTDYKRKNWIFTDWTDVLEWVKNNELEVPPQG